MEREKLFQGLRERIRDREQDALDRFLHDAALRDRVRNRDNQRSLWSRQARGAFYLEVLDRLKFVRH